MTISFETFIKLLSERYSPDHFRLPELYINYTEDPHKWKRHYSNIISTNQPIATWDWRTICENITHAEKLLMLENAIELVGKD